MSDDIIGSLLSLASAVLVALITLAGTILINKRKSRIEEMKEAMERQQMKDRDEYFEREMQEIKKKLDDHNNYAKIFVTVDKKVDIMNVKVESLEKRLDSVVCYPKKGE